MTTPPGPFGLYRPEFEHDACGVNFIVDMKGRRSHDIVQMGIGALCHMEHRGALGAEVNTGDGAGLLLQVPDAFLREVVDFDLPEAGGYATGIAFLPRSPADADDVADQIGKIAAGEGLSVLGWREVPHDPSMIGATAASTLPSFRQVFLAGDGLSGMDLERRAYVARKRMEHEIGPLSATGGVYFPSLSGRTIVYKGMLTTAQLAPFFPDLTDERVTSALALVHSRFSTNTFPSWPLAHPFRFVAHNGEINTVQGNRNWMRAREALMASPELGGDLEQVFPICTPGASDSATFDEALEILHLGGYDLPHAVLMMIPEAWENHADMEPDRRAFYQYHSSLMEPWDGPASIAFTDGTVIGAVLDRNGLRPSRYWVTDDDLVIMASEVGVLDVPPHKVVHKGRLQPGRMFLVDTAQGRIIDDAEIKGALAAEHPYQQWLDDNLVPLDRLLEGSGADAAEAAAQVRRDADLDLLTAQQTFGYTTEELKLIIDPMGHKGAEEIGSMGTDTPLAVLSDRPRLLFDYFIQLFAQVTNPPLDAIREELVTALGTTVGPEGNVLEPAPQSCHQLLLPRPVLTDSELAAVIGVDRVVDGWHTRVLSCLYPVAEGGEGLARALADLRRQATEAIEAGTAFLVLSDRGSTPELAPIPSVLATAAIHHHLIAERSRTRVGLIVEAGDVREVHHVCVLIGYGAGAVNPYLALATAEDLAAERSGHDGAEYVPGVASANYAKAASKGLLKVMSKMGISTVASYTGAQIFEAVGLGEALVEEYFCGTTSRLGGIGLDEVATEVALRHHRAHLPNEAEIAHRPLEVGGEYQWRREGEYHLFNPTTVFKLQHATRTKRFDIFREYTTAVNDQSERLATLRGLLQLRTGELPPVPLDEVESVADICKRFSTGAMSYGSISAEAHETLAVAMNRIGGKSNTGEGGEDPERFVPLPNGDSKRSAIKQVASGRFGVTSEYLTNADDIQIKMAQGAKPGEGGQLPGHKVYPWIAKTRHSTPGVGLISPPPHHDIYSIEDLAQLIHDLKNSNPSARVHVKLVAEVGVGTVAAGVSKAHADVVLISGNDGGTGASPLTSLKHAGGPWELGLAETQQTLLANGLRDRIVVQVDGQMKTGRDVVIAALLGAEEFGFATAPLVVSGCVMPRRRRHPEPGPAGTLHRQAGVRGDVLRVHRHRGA
jgi:glutamate synthase (NADPH/NADH) large chain